MQIAETCSPENEVQLITGSLPQTAAEADAGAVVPMLDQLEKSKLLPEEMLADTAYCGDEQRASGRKPAAWSWWRRSPAARSRAIPRR